MRPRQRTVGPQDAVPRRGTGEARRLTPDRFADTRGRLELSRQRRREGRVLADRQQPRSPACKGGVRGGRYAIAANPRFDGGPPARKRRRIGRRIEHQRVLEFLQLGVGGFTRPNERTIAGAASLTENRRFAPVHARDAGLDVFGKFRFLTQRKLPIENDARGSTHDARRAGAETDAAAYPDRQRDPRGRSLQQNKRRLFADAPAGLVALDDNAVGAGLLGGLGVFDIRDLNENLQSKSVPRLDVSRKFPRVGVAEDDAFESVLDRRRGHLVQTVGIVRQRHGETRVIIAGRVDDAFRDVTTDVFQRDTAPKRAGSRSLNQRQARKPRRTQTDHVELRRHK